MYAAAACLLVSVLLWPFLFAKYRGAPVPAANPAASEAFKPLAEPEPRPAPQPVTEAAKTPAPAVASAEPGPAEPPAAARSGMKNLAPVQEGPRPFGTASSPAVSAAPPASTTSGGISPAVVYLQALKNQVEALKKDMDGLKVQVSGAAQKSDSQFATMLQHLRALDSRLVAAAPQAASSPGPMPEPAPQPAPGPALRDATTPVLSLESELSSVMGTAPSPQAPDAEQERGSPPAQAAPEPESRKRGPVWPV